MPAVTIEFRRRFIEPAPEVFLDAKGLPDNVYESVHRIQAGERSSRAFSLQELEV
jgi:hypothetical protein